MHIKGGLNGQKGNPGDANDEGVFVSKINSVGAARRDGRLKVDLISCCLIIVKSKFYHYIFFLGWNAFTRSKWIIFIRCYTSRSC